MAAEESQDAWFLRSRFPVLFPSSPVLALSKTNFDAAIRADIESQKARIAEDGAKAKDGAATKAASVADASHSTATMNTLNDAGISADSHYFPEPSSLLAAVQVAGATETTGHPFVDGLLSAGENWQEEMPDLSNKMLTENGGMALRSTENPLVDLFYELEEVVSGPRLVELLDAAWAHDSLATLKIIFNCRSIHLGKSTRPTFYRCTGWLLQHHPLTLVCNLQWLVRPVIEKKKKVEKTDAGGDDAVVIETKEADDSDPAHFDVRNGVSHGYWKDILNILALAARDLLDPLKSPRKLLNQVSDKKSKTGKTGKKRTHADSQEEITTEALKEEPTDVQEKPAKEKKREALLEHHETVVRRFEEDATFRAMYQTVVRLFAEQLKSDLAALHGTDRAAKAHISLCAKWAPSLHCFHDRQTFVASSIAEVLHPASEFSPPLADREIYLRHAREAYRKDLSALRAHLRVVERNLSSNTLSSIDYARVPSIAMKNYSNLFASKDEVRFLEYLTSVESGSARISGATLMPSTLVKDARCPLVPAPVLKKMNTEQIMKILDIQKRVADGQWKTLVQRIRDSGTLENCVAVCDVSGSMAYPIFSDKTCPMDSAIGLSLLLAEVAQPPFQGVFITFSETPTVEKVDASRSFSEKVSALQSSSWGGSTDFVSVFRDLILPMATKNKLKQEDMVKRIFVFSDMQFDQAETRGEGRWDTAYEAIEKMYREAGYKLPELVFWNLAGGRAGYGGQDVTGDPTAPKPVKSDTPGTSLVSGYSQAMLKAFLENSSFEDQEVTEEVVEVEMGDLSIINVHETSGQDPLRTVKKAISHKAYDMLRVVD